MYEVGREQQRSLPIFVAKKKNQKKLKNFEKRS